MRRALLTLLSLLPLAAERPLLNVWEQGTLVREVPAEGGLVKERGTHTLATLMLPAALQKPCGQLHHLAHLDGVTYA